MLTDTIIQPLEGVTMTRFCPKCQAETERNPKSDRCIPCHRASTALWRANNPEKAKEANAAWDAAHPDLLKKYGAKWYAKNYEVRKLSQAAWSPSRYNEKTVTGFAAFNTGYLGFSFEAAIDEARSRKADQ